MRQYAGVILILLCIQCLAAQQTLSVQMSDTVHASKIEQYFSLRGTVVSQERLLISDIDAGSLLGDKWRITTEVVVAFSPVNPGDTLSGVSIRIEPMSNLLPSRSSFIDSDELVEFCAMMQLIKKTAVDGYGKSNNYRQMIYRSRDNVAIGYLMRSAKSQPTYFVEVGWINTQSAKMDQKEYDAFIVSVEKALRIISQ